MFQSCHNAKRDTAGLEPGAGRFMSSTRVPAISASAEGREAATITWVMEVKVAMGVFADSVPTAVARTTDQ